MPATRKLVLSAVGLSMLAPLVVAASAAQAGPKPAVVLSGSVGSLRGGPALVVVQVGLPWGANNARHIPVGFHYPAVAVQTITSRSFSIPVLASATLQRGATLGHGIVEFNVLVFSGSRFTSQMYPFTLNSAGANGNRQALAQAQSQAATLGKFRAFAPDPASMRHGVSQLRRTLAAQGSLSPRIAGCSTRAFGSPKEDMTRIGEIHVGSSEGLSMRWTYYATSDTTLTVGLSTSSPTGPWSADGSYTTTNSLGDGSGFTAGNPTLIYTDGDEWYQRYVTSPQQPLCGAWTNQVVSAVADSTEGDNSPPRNPYGGCGPGDSPYGDAAINPHHGFFDADRGTAQGYSADATLWGFTFGGQTGFSSSIHHHYDYSPPRPVGDSYVCGGGSGLMPNSAILYSSGY
jgi:hypothetical protein